MNKTRMNEMEAPSHNEPSAMNEPHSYNEPSAMNVCDLIGYTVIITILISSAGHIMYNGIIEYLN